MKQNKLFVSSIEKTFIDLQYDKNNLLELRRLLIYKQEMGWNCGCLMLCTEGVPIVQSSQRVGGHSDDTNRMASSAKSNNAVWRLLTWKMSSCLL